MLPKRNTGIPRATLELLVGYTLIPRHKYMYNVWVRGLLPENINDLIQITSPFHATHKAKTKKREAMIHSYRRDPRKDPKSTSSRGAEWNFD